MNQKKSALQVMLLLLVALLACRSPLPAQNGADSQLPEPLYTLTSLPPFPTAPAVVAGKAAAASATNAAEATATVRVATVDSSTIVPPATPVASATTIARLPGSRTPGPRPRSIPPVIARYLAIRPRLDGNWGEWKDLTDEYPANSVVWGKKKWTGPEDLSSSYRLGWDDKFLYLGMKVRDDQYVQNTTGADLFNGDSLELLLDTQLMEDYASHKLSDDDFQLGLSAGNPDPGAGKEAYLWFPNYLAGRQRSIQVEARAESGIYRVEVAIPWSVFKMEPVVDAHYGFSISVSDNDDGDGRVQQSMVSNLPVRDPNDPTTWADLQLVR